MPLRESICRPRMVSKQCNMYIFCRFHTKSWWLYLCICVDSAKVIKKQSNISLQPALDWVSLCTFHGVIINLANVIYQSIHPRTNQNTRQRITELYTDDRIEIWWDTRIKTLVKLELDKPDIVLWRREERKCFIIDICVCLDVNIDKNIELKQNYYLPLAAELKRLYPEYTYEVLPVIIGATGLVTKQIVDILKKL